jgi:hypothetical protein
MKKSTGIVRQATEKNKNELVFLVPDQEEAAGDPVVKFLKIPVEPDFFNDG